MHLMTNDEIKKTISLRLEVERDSDSQHGEDPTEISAQYALYADYQYSDGEGMRSGTVFVTYLFKAVITIATGAVIFTETKSPDAVTESDITTAVLGDVAIKLQTIASERQIKSKIAYAYKKLNDLFKIDESRSQNYKNNI